MEDLARQHRIPVVHQGKILPVVTAEAVQVVGECLTGCEVLFEAAEAGIHRMTAYINDGRVRQHRLNQADVAEVVRHLVNESCPPGAQRSSLLDVAATELLEYGPWGGLQPLGIRIAIGAPPLEFARVVQDV